MHRRSLLVAAGMLSAPRPSRADGARTLRFVPYADIAIIDPVWQTNDAPRTHAHLVCETLFGVDEAGNPHRQMLAGLHHRAGRPALTPDAPRRPRLPRRQGGARA